MALGTGPQVSGLSAYSQNPRATAWVQILQWESAGWLVGFFNYLQLHEKCKWLVHAQSPSPLHVSRFPPALRLSFLGFLETP